MGDLTKIKNSSTVGITGGDESVVSDVVTDSDGVKKLQVKSTDKPNTTGTTTQIPGSATTTPTDYPAVAGNVISLILIENFETKKTEILDYSFDGGTTYSKLKPGSFVGWPPKGDKTQIKIKRNASATANVEFNIILNRVP